MSGATERTLCIIKPDAVARGAIGKIVARIEAAGLRLVAARMLWLTRAQAEGFYAVHRERPFFASLTAFMSEGPIVAAVLEGEGAIGRLRELMGPTDPARAPAGTLRAEFGTDVERNAIHGSDGPETAAWEITYFFGRLDIVGGTA